MEIRTRFMLSFIQKSISLKITFALVAILSLVLGGFAFMLLKQRSSALETMLLSKARTHAIVGARAMESVLEEALSCGALTREQLFDFDYRRITEGPLSTSDIPKFSTPYDRYLDGRILGIQDAFLEDEMVAFAVLVDHRGYLPTHNSRYSLPLSGDPVFDRNWNRTKRIFNDPVGLAAAEFDRQGEILRQVYRRDTGETMWDVASPVFVGGTHWGAFRVGFSIHQMEAAISQLRATIAGLFLITLAAISLTIHFVVLKLTAPLKKVTDESQKVARGDSRRIEEPPCDDEIGTLVRVFNGMLEDLNATTVNKQYMDDLLSSIHEALLVVSSTGRILKINLAATRLFGLASDCLLSMNILDMLPDRSPSDEDWFKTLWKREESTVFEITYRKASGEQFTASTSLSHLRRRGGSPDALIWLVQDISDRKRAQQDLLESKKFLETVLNSIGDAISILDAETFEVLGCNRLFLERSGHKELSDVLGRTCFDVTHHGIECWKAGEICPMEETRQTGENASCEHIHVDKDGWEEHVQLITCPIKDADGRVRKVVHVARDITVQKNIETELRISSQLLERSNQELMAKTAELEEAYQTLQSSQLTIMQQEKMASIGQLAAGVAHEINNPIGFISSNLRTLQKYQGGIFEYLDAQESRLAEGGMEQEAQELAELKKRLKIDYLRQDSGDLISESLEGAERVRQIVAGLKSFSRVDQAEQGLADINECLDSTINIVWNELKYKATLERDYGALPRTWCYPQQLNQVFMNLLVNAGHAIEDQGVIRVRTRLEKDRILISVSDSGCGITDEHQSRIFEPFFTTKEVGKGTGLGLSIAYDIIQKHNGDIRVQSEPGKGTCFTILLPQRDSAPGEAQQPRA